MPKRTRPYHEFLIEQLRDERFASRYLEEARKDSPEILDKAIRNVAEAKALGPAQPEQT